MKKSEQVRRALENWRKGRYTKWGICLCLGYTNQKMFNTVSNDISKMIGKHLYVSSWLFAQGIPRELLTPENMREYRELWLEHLMNYYLSIGE